MGAPVLINGTRYKAGRVTYQRAMHLIDGYD